MRRLRDSGWLGLLGCLVAVLLIGVLVPDPATDVRRQWAEVGVGEVGRLRLYDVEVLGVRTAGEVGQPDRDPLAPDSDPAAVFVVVQLRLAVRVRPATFTGLTLVTGDGRRYDPRPEFITAGPVQTQPGFTRTASLVFTLPPDRVAGSTLEVEPDPTTFDGYDRAVRVDLGLDDEVSRATVVLDEPVLVVTR